MSEPKPITVADDVTGGRSLSVNSVRKDNNRASVTEVLRIEKQTRIFASMCPDEVLDYYDSYETRGYNTVLMLGDVSGFTDMTEKYTKSGKGGPSKLTDTLNSYIGTMVQEILSHKGDVLKFSGDAFIVMWKVGEGRVMRDIATEAIKTACIIQKHFGIYETDVNVALRVKLAIASGKTYFTSIGGLSSVSYYIITGKPVWEVKLAEGLCRGGDIIVAASCWQWINPTEYIYEALPDGIHTLIVSLSVLWDSTKEEYSDADSATSEEKSIDIEEQSITSEQANTEEDTQFFQQQTENVTDYSLRPKVIKVAKAKLNRQLRRYIPRPVIRSVEMDEPLEYLTEIRQVVIVFVNVVLEEINRKTLIKLVQAAYSFVCKTVGEVQGCVNKTSLFDKDLMFLCIFGLRGDKHELESQVGLRCASKLRKGLIKFQNIKSVTVGVTTGMTYCGVVGYVLRREYTVIGMAVNKAARLMCAYVNKVVCDRESFLQSHLEARHFVLQKAKALKGISNVGPIYEFVEQMATTGNSLTINRYPLLGRDVQLKIFYDMLNLILEDFQYSRGLARYMKKLLLIRGEARMGKTRLLDEMAAMTPNRVPVNYITLTPYDHQLPYVLVRLIFYLALDVQEVSSIHQRQEKLIPHFLDRDMQYLCCLNPLFGVNFPITRVYKKLTAKKRGKIIKRLLGRLSRSCFNLVWVIIVDDAELADDESLSLLHTVAKQKNILLILSFGHKISPDFEIPHSLLRIATMLDIYGLNKWYHAALGCQTMDVVAIPPELEKVLQERSNGNPGWIESYLISLLQAGGAEVKSLTRREIHEMGLVVPPKKMIKRVLDISRFDREVVEDAHDGWEMFQSSYRESVSEDTEEFYNDVVTYSVCTVTPDFKAEQAAEATMDSILLTLYDSLTPLDQFLLKCAAVLGEMVDRKMLLRLMQSVPLRDVGHSLVKLFEFRILGCTVGDVKKSDDSQHSFRKPKDAKLNSEVYCGCQNVEVPADLEDLPPYACCQLMRFKMDMFRQTTYGLLTENQKVEFHSKALRYLQQNTRRCASCGGGQFNRLLGETALDEFERKRSELHASMYRSSLDEGPPAPLIRETKDDENDRLSLFTMCKPIARLPTRTFSNVDFSNCGCNLILLTAYNHATAHCRGIGVKQLLLVGILEFVEVCIWALNIPQATKLLQEGEVLIDSIFTAIEDELIVLPYLKGKIYTLRGRCFLESGLNTEAMRCFENALRIMNYTFPDNPLSMWLKSCYLLKQQEMMITFLRNFKVGILEGDSANYCDQFANCLAQMFVVYRLKGMNDYSKLAAIWGLNAALQSSKDFFVLCTSYANMLIIAHNYQYTTMIPLLERDAINLCNKRKHSIELQDLNAVAELYTQIYFSRYLRGIIEGAWKIGLTVSRIAKSIKSMRLQLLIIPRLIALGLNSSSRYSDIPKMLQELEVLAKSDMDQSGETWLYALCMDLLLATGIRVKKPRECEQFYQHESSHILNLRDSEAARRFFICMWLWYARIGDWEAATVWRDRKCDDDSYVDEYSVVTAITELKKVEVLLITYVYKLDQKNLKDAATIMLDIKESFGIIEDLTRVVKVIKARYLLMKAYYYMVKFKNKAGIALARKAKNLASVTGNNSVSKWAEHCERLWTGVLPKSEENFWKDQATDEKLFDLDEDNLENYTVMPFSLPLPQSQTNS